MGGDLNNVMSGPGAACVMVPIALIVACVVIAIMDWKKGRKP